MQHERYFFGRWEKGGKPLTAEDIESLLEMAEKARKRLADYPEDRIFAVLAKLKEKWADPNYPPRVEMERELPSTTGFSSEMIKLGMNELSSILDPEVLKKKLETELGRAPAYPEIRYEPQTQTLLHRYPVGIILHVLSGNVFLVGVGSWLEGLITKNITLLKAPSSENRFLPLFLKSVQECDSEGVVASSVALIDYPSRAVKVIETLKRRVDGIVVWGGEEAVRAYREGLPARTRITVFGPKLSLALVTSQGLKSVGIETLAQKLALEMSLWDQNACTAPQVCYVEGDAEAKALSRSLALELKLMEKKIPAGPVDIDSAVEIQKLRGVHEVAAARGLSELHTSGPEVNWTVICDKKLDLEPSPLHRTIRVIPYGDIGDVLGETGRLRGYVQTVGLAAGVSEAETISDALSKQGVLRILEIGEMHGGEIDDPHDGSYDLPQLVNIVVRRPKVHGAESDPVDYLPQNLRQALLDSRLRQLIDKARRAPYYAKLLQEKRIENTKDLIELPILTREKMEANMPPQGTGLSTGPTYGGYVSRSGGSTGVPKFSLYDAHDWEAMISQAERVLRAAGLRRGDRLANCMLAGDLYGSFVSFDHISCRIGAQTFAFANQVTPEVLVDMWRKFDLNVLLAIPTVLVPLLRKAKALEPGFTMPKIIFGGTPLSPSDSKWLTQELGVERISSIIGANDGGQLAYQCSSQSGRFHHLVDDFNYVEIVDEQGRLVEDGQAGRILITSLLKYAYPLIRYEIGDAGRIVKEPCPCGRSSRVLEYLGRADDVLCVANMNVHYRDFVGALEGLPLSAIQLAATNSPKGESLCLRAESSEAGRELANRIREALLEKIKYLSLRLNDGSLVSLDVEVHASGGLPRNTRSGKIKGIVDERQ